MNNVAIADLEKLYLLKKENNMKYDEVTLDDLKRCYLKVRNHIYRRTQEVEDADSYYCELYTMITCLYEFLLVNHYDKHNDKYENDYKMVMFINHDLNSNLTYYSHLIKGIKKINESRYYYNERYVEIENMLSYVHNMIKGVQNRYIYTFDIYNHLMLCYFINKEGKVKLKITRFLKSFINNARMPDGVSSELINYINKHDVYKEEDNLIPFNNI